MISFVSLSLQKKIPKLNTGDWWGREIYFRIGGTFYSIDVPLKRADPNLIGGPIQQTCVHLASSRHSSQSAQVIDKHISILLGGLEFNKKKYFLVLIN